MKTTNELRGGLIGDRGTKPIFSLPEGTPTEKLDASTIDTLSLVACIMNGKPFAAGARAVEICRREKLNAELLGVLLSEQFEPNEIAYMLALSLVTLGAK